MLSFAKMFSFLFITNSTIQNVSEKSSHKTCRQCSFYFQIIQSFYQFIKSLSLMKRYLIERKCFPGKCVTYPEKLVSEITSSSDSVQSLINCAHSEEYSPNTQAKRFSRAQNYVHVN